MSEENLAGGKKARLSRCSKSLCPGCCIRPALGLALVLRKFGAGNGKWWNRRSFTGTVFQRDGEK